MAVEYQYHGTEDPFDIYAATVIWDGRPRNILIEAITISKIKNLDDLQVFL